MAPTVEGRPRLTGDQVAAALRDSYGLEGTLKPLPGEWDQNFRLREGSGAGWVVKIANAGHEDGVLDLQNAALGHLAGSGVASQVPRVLPAREGGLTVRLAGEGWRMRVLSWVEGEPLARRMPAGIVEMGEIGAALGRLDEALEGFTHPAMERDLFWDIRRASWISPWTRLLDDPALRELVERCLLDFRGRLLPGLDALPRQVIHNDANDENILLAGGGREVTGLLDFGDMVRTHRIHELAVAGAYVLSPGDGLPKALEALVGGYVAQRPLMAAEILLLPSLIRTRLCVSLVNAARAAREDPGNAHRQTSAAPARALLEALGAWPALEDRAAWEETARRLGTGRSAGPDCPPVEALLERRRRLLGPSLSLSYERPLAITGGWGSWLLDRRGRAWLDCVNNVCHVGHAHPRVAGAIAAQAARLNTNTRYLHPLILEYAERLAATFPDPLEVCYFVNSGSEANDLALRMARTSTGRRGGVTLDHAYHGHTQALIEVSPYKCDGVGGEGLPAWIRKIPAPDPYRGVHAGKGREAGRAYAEELRRACSEMAAAGEPPAFFIAESLQGCGGQIVPPDGFLREAFRIIREAGGVAVADEVQVGMGRVGSHWWAFRAQEALPDIVTLGKPLGNGHPLAAVVTTRAVAEAFDNGMEYFNTFGGNPVSMAAGLAVMDVVEEEGLMDRAQETGRLLLDGFRELQRDHPSLGEVRGSGLFLGLELVKSRSTREPDPRAAAALVRSALEDGLLLSTDGPHRNVVKIKPPMVFGPDDARALLWAVERALRSR